MSTDRISGRHLAISPLFALLAIFGVIYFVELASFPFSHDEEWAIFRTNPAVWIAQGRWGAYLVEKYLLATPIMPFVPMALFGLGCAFSYLLILDRIGRDVRRLSGSDYAAFAIFCGFPTWFFITEFYSNIGAIAIGFASATLAVWLVKSEWTGWGVWTHHAAAILLSAFAISIYQSLALYIAALGLGLAILKSLEDNGRIATAANGRFVAVFIASLIVYFCVDRLARLWLGGNENYVDTFVHIDFLFGNPVRAFAKTVAEAAWIYGFSGRAYRGPMWAMLLVLAGGCAGLVFILRQFRLAASAPVALAAVVLLGLPFALSLLYPGILPVRIAVAVPVVVWFFAYLGLNSGSRPIRLWTAAALALAVVQLIILQNKNQTSNYFVAKHDVIVAASIYERLGAVPGFSSDATYALAVFGGHDFQSRYIRPMTSTVGASFFSPSNGNSVRIVSYMRLLGLGGLRPTTDAELDQVIVKLSKMPVWPKAGSVALDGDMLLVRLGELPAAPEKRSLDRVGVAP